jgi:hypothetical protein
MTAPSPVNILLDLREPSCFAEDWEATFTPPLFPSARLTRFIERSDERVLLPFDLPMTLLMCLPSSQKSSLAGAPEDYQQYYKILRATGLDNNELLALMRNSTFNIAHLQVHGAWGSGGEGQLSVEDGPDISTWIKAKELTRTAAASKLRLMLLHCQDAKSYGVSLDVAHRMLIAGGPTVIVIEILPTWEPHQLLNDLYYNIVHNLTLDEIVKRVRSQSVRAALLCGIGGAGVLQVSLPALELTSKVTSMGLAANDASDLIKARLELEADLWAATKEQQPAESRESSMEFKTMLRPKISEKPIELILAEEFYIRSMEIAKASEEVVSRSLNYASETGAWIPIWRAQRELREMAKKAESLRSVTDRVVNVSVRDGDRRLRNNESLMPGAPYRLAIQIGRRADWTLIKGPVAFPDQALRRFYREEGIELRVAIFAGKFEVKESEKKLLLPPPPAESHEIVFEVHTPRTKGRHGLRICIYYKQNLLQSILLHASVADEAVQVKKVIDGIRAEVEYTLSGSLRDIERFQPRSVNLLLNRSEQGTHTLVVKGTSIREQFDFTEGEMRSAASAAREALVEICAEPSSRPPRYRFDNQNQGTLAQLEDDLRRLAEVGYTLFTNIVTAKDLSFQRRLLAELGVSGATIQVSTVKSATHVFPWALVYDHPIVRGGATLCPDFKTDLEAGTTAGFLSGQRCLSTGCAHKGDTSIFCPSGFWGFKHLIEQPISLGDKKGGAKDQDLVLDINVNRPDRRVPLMMAISRDLQQVEAHHVDLQTCPEFDLSLKDNKLEIGLGLKGLAQGLVYFYCHGGRDKSETWLGVGRSEKIYASELNAWGIDWSHRSPLVFINGCHTVDITPDDLLNFCRTLGYVRAAGIIGTEISVHETLARDFATGFLRRVSSGNIAAGAAMREQRLALLERCNPLGLAYTPYCSADLSVKFS